MSARVSFSFVLTFLVLLCQTLATKPGALGPCRKVAKKMGAVTSPGFANYVRVVGDKHGSGFQSRKLMQDISCEWDAEEELCGVSNATLAKLLVESASPFGRFLGQIGSCDVQSRKRQCKKVGYCIWNKPDCTLADVSFGHEDSPCVKHAPGFFAYLAAQTQCEVHKRQAVCEAPLCEWDADEGVCDADVVETFLASGDDDAEDVEALIDSLEGEGDREFLRTSLACVEQDRASCTGDCEWDSEDESCGPTARVILGALVPDDYTSGDGVCDYLLVFAQSDCVSYGTQTQCLADDTCEYDEDGCTIDRSVLISAAAAEDPVLAAQVAAARKACGTSTTPDTCA